MKIFTDQELDQLDEIEGKISNDKLQLSDLECLSKRQLEKVCIDWFGGLLKGKTKKDLLERIVLKARASQ